MWCICIIIHTLPILIRLVHSEYEEGKSLMCCDHLAIDTSKDVCLARGWMTCAGDGYYTDEKLCCQGTKFTIASFSLDY